MDLCGLFWMRGGAPRRAKRGGSQWEAVFRGVVRCGRWTQAARSRNAQGVGVSVEGPGRLFAREQRAGFLPRFFGRHRCAHVVVLKDNEEGYLGQRS